jgi:hypothetical protein
VAFGYRVGLSLELRPAEVNEVLEERDENIWDDVQVDDEYTNEVSSIIFSPSKYMPFVKHNLFSVFSKASIYIT